MVGGELILAPSEAPSWLILLHSKGPQGHIVRDTGGVLLQEEGEELLSTAEVSPTQRRIQPTATQDLVWVCVWLCASPY